MRRYSTRAQAVAWEIIEPMGEHADGHDVEAIAVAVLGDYSQGYACTVDAPTLLGRRRAQRKAGCVMRTITRLSTFCGRCGVVSEPVVVPSSSGTVELADALQRLGWCISRPAGLGAVSSVRREAAGASLRLMTEARPPREGGAFSCGTPAV